MRVGRRWWILSTRFITGGTAGDNLSTYHYLTKLHGFEVRYGEEGEETACGIKLPKDGAYAKLVAAADYPTKRCEKCLEARNKKSTVRSSSVPSKGRRT